MRFYGWFYVEEAGERYDETQEPVPNLHCGVVFEATDADEAEREMLAIRPAVAARVKHRLAEGVEEEEILFKVHPMAEFMAECELLFHELRSEIADGTDEEDEFGKPFMIRGL